MLMFISTFPGEFLRAAADDAVPESEQETIETMAAEPSEETEPAEEAQPSESSETSSEEDDDLIITPVPTPTAIPEAGYTMISRTETVTADDGRELTVRGILPDNAVITAQAYESDYFPNAVCSYSITLTDPDGNVIDMGRPIEVSFAADIEDQFIVYEDDINGFFRRVDSAYYAGGRMTIVLTSVYRFAVDTVTVLPGGEEDTNLIPQTLEAEIYADADYGNEIRNPDINITVSGSLPAGAVAKAYPTSPEIGGVRVIAAYDITIFDAEGNVFEPKDDTLNVTMTGDVISEAISGCSQLDVYHVSDDGEATIVSSEVTDEETVEFIAEEFSTFAVVSYEIPTSTDTTSRYATDDFYNLITSDYNFALMWQHNDKRYFGVTTSSDNSTLSNRVAVNVAESDVRSFNDPSYQNNIQDAVSVIENTPDKYTRWYFDNVSIVAAASPNYTAFINDSSIALPTTEVKANLYTIINGERYYLNFDMSKAVKFRESLSKTNPSDILFQAVYYNGQMRFRMMYYESSTRYMFYYKGNADRTRVDNEHFPGSGAGVSGIDLSTSGTYTFSSHSNKEYNFSAWSWFWIIPCESTTPTPKVVYNYDPHADGITTSPVMPADHTVDILDALPATYTVQQPSVNSYICDDGAYSFDHWEIDCDDIPTIDGTSVNPGNTITIPADYQGTINLISRWRQEPSVRYNYDPHADGITTSPVMPADSTVVITDALPATYTVQQPSVNSYDCDAGAYYFDHWELDCDDLPAIDGTPVHPGDTITIPADYQGNIDLISRWRREPSVRYKYEPHAAGITTSPVMPADSTVNIAGELPAAYTVLQPSVDSYGCDDGGYFFDHWELDCDDIPVIDGTSVDPGDKITVPAGYTGTINIISRWRREPSVRYTYEQYHELDRPLDENHDPITLSDYNVAPVVLHGSTYEVQAPTLDEYHSHAGINLVYKFYRWKIRSADPLPAELDGIIVEPGDVIDLGSFTGDLEFVSTWKITRAFFQLKYDLNIPADTSSERVVSVPNLIGSTTYDSSTSMDRYDIPLDVGINGEFIMRTMGFARGQEFYKSLDLRSTQSNKHNYISYMFLNWQTETSNSSMAYLDPLAPYIITYETAQFYDSNKDGVITFKANWSKKIPNTNVPAFVNFSLKTEVYGAETSLDDLNLESASSGTYSCSLFGTGVYTNVYDYLDNPSSDSISVKFKRFHIVNGESDIYEIDEMIHESAVTPLMGDSDAEAVNNPGTQPRIDLSEAYMQLAEVPSDDILFENMRAYQQPRMSGESQGRKAFTEKINGVNTVIPVEDLTAENFTIRWYVVKIQSPSSAYSWFIDGILVRNGSYVAVTKTFAGNTIYNDVINNTDHDTRYWIDVTRLIDQGGTKSTLPQDKYRLLIESREAEIQAQNLTAGRIHTYQESSYGITEYGYAKREVDTTNHTVTYTWLMLVSGKGNYKVEEANYKLHGFGVIAQYDTVDSEGNETEPLQQWSGTIEATTTQIPVDSIEVGDVNKANLINTYVKLGIFTIFKRDDVSSLPMPGVNFEVFNVTDYTGPITADNGDESGWGKEQYRWKFSYNSEEEYYEMSDNAGAADLDMIPTGSDGDVRFTLPFRTDIGTPYTFVVREIVPEGYDESIAPILKITVDTYTDTEVDPPEIHPHFNVEVIHGNGIDGKDYVQLQTLMDPYAGYVAGAIIRNVTEKVDITVSKVWESGLSFDSVDAEIIGTYDDAAGGQASVHDIRLNYGNSWKKSITLPVMIENRPVRYTVVEKNIADKPTWYYDNIINRVDYTCTGDNGYSMTFTDTDVGTAAANYNIRVVTDMKAVISNSYPAHAPISFRLHNLDVDDHTIHLHDGVFSLYRNAAYGDYTIDGIKTTLMGSVRFFDSEEEDIILDSGYTYYLIQDDVQDGYIINSGFIKIEISGRGEITLTPVDDQICSLTEPAHEGDPAYLDIYNKKIDDAMPAPTNYSSQGQFARPMLILGIFLGVLALVPLAFKSSIIVLENRKRRRRWISCAKK